MRTLLKLVLPLVLLVGGLSTPSFADSTKERLVRMAREALAIPAARRTTPFWEKYGQALLAVAQFRNKWSPAELQDWGLQESEVSAARTALTSARPVHFFDALPNIAQGSFYYDETLNFFAEWVKSPGISGQIVEESRHLAPEDLAPDRFRKAEFLLFALGNVAPDDARPAFDAFNLLIGKIAQRNVMGGEDLEILGSAAELFFSDRSRFSKVADGLGMTAEMDAAFERALRNLGNMVLTDEQVDEFVSRRLDLLEFAGDSRKDGFLSDLKLVTEASGPSPSRAEAIIRLLDKVGLFPREPSPETQKIVKDAVESAVSSPLSSNQMKDLVRVYLKLTTTYRGEAQVRREAAVARILVKGYRDFVEEKSFDSQQLLSLSLVLCAG